MGWAGKVDEPAVAALAELLETKYNSQLDVLPDLLRACATGKPRTAPPAGRTDAQAVCGGGGEGARPQHQQCLLQQPAFGAGPSTHHALRPLRHAADGGEGRITIESVQRAATQSWGAQQVEVLEVIGAFDAPKLMFDPVQRKLLLDNAPRSLHATAEVGAARLRSPSSADRMR